MDGIENAGLAPSVPLDLETRIATVCFTILLDSYFILVILIFVFHDIQI